MVKRIKFVDDWRGKAFRWIHSSGMSSRALELANHEEIYDNLVKPAQNAAKQHYETWKEQKTMSEETNFERLQRKAKKEDTNWLLEFIKEATLIGSNGVDEN